MRTSPLRAYFVLGRFTGLRLRLVVAGLESKAKAAQKARRKMVGRDRRARRIVGRTLRTASRRRGIPTIYEIGRGPAGWYVLTRTPRGVLRVATRVRPLGGTPFSNSRFPSPSTTGNIQMRFSSTRSAAISVCSNSLLPQICNSGPSDVLSWRTSSTTSPSIRCDFRSEAMLVDEIGGDQRLQQFAAPPDMQRWAVRCLKLADLLNNVAVNTLRFPI